MSAVARQQDTVKAEGISGLHRSLICSPLWSEEEVLVLFHFI